MHEELFSQLIEAVKRNNTQLVWLYLTQGVNPNAYERLDQVKLSLLHFAVIYNAYDAATLLIQAGANPEVETITGEKPVDYLCSQSDPRLVRLLQD